MVCVGITQTRHIGTPISCSINDNAVSCRRAFICLAWYGKPLICIQQIRCFNESRAQTTILQQRFLRSRLRWHWQRPWREQTRKQTWTNTNISSPSVREKNVHNYLLILSFAYVETDQLKSEGGIYGPCFWSWDYLGVEDSSTRYGFPIFTCTVFWHCYLSPAFWLEFESGVFCHQFLMGSWEIDIKAYVSIDTFDSEPMDSRWRPIDVYGQSLAAFEWFCWLVLFPAPFDRYRPRMLITAPKAITSLCAKKWQKKHMNLLFCRSNTSN